MRNTTWTSALSIMGVALLVSSCTSDAAATDDEPAPSASEEVESVAASEEEAVDGSEDISVPLSEEHLAEGVEMLDGCLEANIRVEPGMIFSEAELVEMCPSEPADDREFRPSQQLIVGNSVEIRYLDGEEGSGVEVHHLHCEDEDALAEKAAHNGESQPVGWPQDWDGTGSMPDPYCHPDYLEVGEWEHLEAFASVWEGEQTSTLVDSGQPQAEIDQFLWEQSQARAEWTP